MSLKKKCIRLSEDGEGTDGEYKEMSDTDGELSCIHDSDSVFSSPANLSAREDVFSTPHNSSILKSPLVRNSSCEFSDMDMMLKPSDVSSVQHFPLSAFRMHREGTLEDRCMLPHGNIPSLDSPMSSRSSGLSRSYSVESLAKSSVNSDSNDHVNRSFDCVLSPLPSPGENKHIALKLGTSTIAEDINKFTNPKQRPSGVNNSFSISTLSVSAATPTVNSSWQM